MTEEKKVLFWNELGSLLNKYGVTRGFLCLEWGEGSWVSSIHCNQNDDDFRLIAARLQDCRDSVVRKIVNFEDERPLPKMVN